MLKTLLSFQLSTIRKFFKTKTLAKLITVGLFLGVFFFVISTLYFFLVTGLRFTLFQMTSDTRDALLYFIFESFYLTLFLLTVLSACISLLFSLFRKKKDAWFMSSPHYTIYTRLTVIRVFLGAVIPIAVLFLPMVASLKKVIHLGAFQIFELYASLTFLTLLTVSFVTIFILLLGTCASYCRKIFFKKQLRFGELSALFAFIIITFAVYGTLSLRHIDLPKLFKTEDASARLEPKVIAESFAWSPSHMPATQLFCITTKDVTCQAKHTIALFVLTLFCLYLCKKLSPLHFTLWKVFQDKGRTSSHMKVRTRLSYFNHSQLRSAFEREYMSITRDMRSLFWLLFLIAIWVGEIVVHSLARYTYIKHGINFEEYLPRLVATQVMITIYFVSAFTLRFVYPSFSTEKKMAWILGTAPLAYIKRFRAKLAFYLCFFVTLGTFMNFLSASFLSFKNSSLLHSLLVLIPSLLLIVVFGLFLGIFFPSDEGDDAESSTTSMPGLTFTLLSLMYGALGTYTLFSAEYYGNYYYLYLYTLVTTFMAIGIYSFTRISLQSKKGSNPHFS